MTDRPGKEIPKDYREVIEHLIDNEGWTYRKARGGGYPQLSPADPSRGTIRVPKTPQTRGNRFPNWISQIRRAGGHWPPGR